MRALVLDAESRTAHVRDVAPPTPRPLEVLVRVHCVTLNPVDSLYVAQPLGATGRTVGSDFAGVIVEAGSDVPDDVRSKRGTRVAGFLQGACSVNDRPGAFAELLVCPWDLVYVIPEAMSFQPASTMSLCGLTAAQAIYYRLGLSAPWQNGIAAGAIRNDTAINFFVYSASTSVAMYAAQLLRRSAEATGTKFKLLGTASKNRFSLLRTRPYLYDVLVDYREPDWQAQILKEADGHCLDYAPDCISEGNSVGKSSHMLRKGGKMAIVRSREAGAWKTQGLRKDVDPIYGAVWEGLGEGVQYQGLTVPKSPEARRFATEFYQWLSNGGQPEPNPVRLMPGGLEHIVADGFTLLAPTMKDREQLRARSRSWMRPLSAEKLVYDVERSEYVDC